MADEPTPDVQEQPQPDPMRDDITVLAEDIWVTHSTTTDDLDDVPVNRRWRARIGRSIGIPMRAEIQALRGVNVRAFEGENIGVIGVNGSGKSTLLRVIAGLHPPDRGRVLTTATPNLLGVNAALMPKLTGKKNVELGLLAMGFTPQEVREHYPRVAELASIGAAMNRPMSTYSSGMSARVRFAIAMANHPEILIIDEALGTGDARFTAKAEEALAEYRAQAGTIFLVTHAAQQIQKLCSRAIWLHEGRVLMDGPAEPVAKHYRRWTWATAKQGPERAQAIFDAIPDSPYAVGPSLPSEHDMRE